MIESSTLSGKYQITLPKRVREDIGARSGDKIIFVKVNGSWSILKLPGDPVAALKYLGKRAGLSGTPQDVHKDMEDWEK